MVKKRQVSSYGRYTNCRGVISTPKAQKSGYIHIQIQYKTYSLHRVMALAFDLPRKEGQNTVDHIDGNPSNPRLDNLRWASYKEQMEYSYSTNKDRESSGYRQSKPVEGRVVGTDTWIKYNNSYDVSRKLNIHPSNVRTCCNGKCKRVEKYEFRFAEANEPDVLDGEVWTKYKNVNVSSYGRYKNCHGVISTPKPYKSGYVDIRIQKKTHSLHRVIALAFDLPKKEGQNTVDHIDGNPSNNRLDNLRWASHKEQI